MYNLVFLQVIAILVAFFSVEYLIGCLFGGGYTAKQKIIRIVCVVLIVSVCASSFILPKVLSKPKANTDTYWEELEEQSNTFVYITDTGQCYHRKYCQYLYSSEFSLTVAEAKECGYRPCKKCNPPR